MREAAGDLAVGPEAGAGQAEKANREAEVVQGGKASQEAKVGR